MKIKNENIIQNTTCFKEHLKHSVHCEKTLCRHWHEINDYYNCTIIAGHEGPKTLQEIGDIFHVTRMRVCQIEKNVLKKLNKKYTKLIKK